jgi:hypothetical protein
MKYINKFETFIKESYMISEAVEESELTVGQKVRVFRNLNTSTVMYSWDRKGVNHNESNDDVIWSIRDSRSSTNYKTLYYSYNVILKNVSFLVQQGSVNADGIGTSYRQLTLSTGQKNPHAYIIGEIQSWDNYKFRKPNPIINTLIDTNDFEVHETGATGWIAAYYKPTELDRYVVPIIPTYVERGIAGRELVSAEECILGQSSFKTKEGKTMVRPFVYVLNPVFSDYQKPLNSEGKFDTEGVVPKGRKSSGNYQKKLHKANTLLNTIDTDGEEDILGKLADKWADDKNNQM